MNLDYVRNQYYQHSGSLSETNRKLCYAGIAAVWVFAFQGKGADATDFGLNRGLVFSLVLFVCGLSADLLQYWFYSINWHSFLGKKEKELRIEGTDKFDEEEEFNPTKKINKWGDFFHIIKVYITGAACVVMIISMAWQLF